MGDHAGILGAAVPFCLGEGPVAQSLFIALQTILCLRLDRGPSLFEAPAMPDTGSKLNDSQNGDRRLDVQR